MSSPPPIDWSEPGAPRSSLYGDVYFSLDDGLAESRAVFLQGCGLPQAWPGRRHFTVAELGFGTGLNIVALIDLWRRHRPANGRLHILSIEAHPLGREDAARALSAWPEIAEAARSLLERWPRRAAGFHRMDLPDGVTLDLAIGDATWALSQWSGQADAWFLDGFSPALNPAMWSDQVLDLIATRSAPGARLATFTVAGAVRRGLAARGFTVEKRPGHGRKRERLEARLEGERVERAPPRVAIVGGGVAGAAVARALAAQGLEPVVIEAQAPGADASGFASALVSPRLDAGDEGIASLYAQMLHRAADLYRGIPDAVLADGLLRLEHGARDAVRFDRVAAQSQWESEAVSRLSAAQAAERLGEDTSGGLLFADGLAIAPHRVLADWLAAVPVVNASVARIEHCETGWRLFDAEGDLVADADQVVLAGGWRGAALIPALGLSPVRGQATTVPGPVIPAVTWGGYAAPTSSGVLFGATHDRDRPDDAVDPADDARNLTTLAAALPGLAASLDQTAFQGRAAVRAVTGDRLPICGEIGDGLFVLSGLGSRGWTAAPLLGEHIAALIANAPSPMPENLASRIRPFRPGGLAQPLPSADS